MKIEVNISKRRFFVLLGAVLLVGGGIFVFAYMDGVYNDPAVFGHSAGEIEGVVVGGGLSFGDWIDKTSVASGGVVQGPAVTDGFVVAYTPTASGGIYDIYGYTDSISNPTTLVAVQKSSAVYAEDPQYQIMMPVKKGNYWKVVGNVQKVLWLPVSGGSSGGSIENHLISGPDATTVTATCSSGKTVVFATAFTNDIDLSCSSRERNRKCSDVTFPNCIGDSSCTYTGKQNDCSDPGDTCLQVLCA
jgi:hypothetical protein